MRFRFLALYVSWIAGCALLFAALHGVEDPSRRRDRILSDEAAVRAVSILRADARYRGYEAVHVAWAGREEGSSESRWIVLCDRSPHSALRQAVVVELASRDGRLLRLRRPVSEGQRPESRVPSGN